MPRQKVTVEICGSNYVVSTDDTPEYLRGLAERVDDDMGRLLVQMPNASVTAAAVLCSLNYLDEADKNTNNAENMRSQLQDYLEDASKARLETEELRRENAYLRRELERFERADDTKRFTANPNRVTETTTTKRNVTRQLADEELTLRIGEDIDENSK